MFGNAMTLRALNNVFRVHKSFSPTFFYRDLNFEFPFFLFYTDSFSDVMQTLHSEINLTCLEYVILFKNHAAGFDLLAFLYLYS